MKKVFIICACGVALFASAQTGNVGINTTDPKKELDVNGHVRVRVVDTNTQPDYYASYDADGVLQKAKAQRIVAADVDTSKGPVDVYVNGNMTNYSDLGLNLNLSVPAGKKYGVNIFYSVPMGTVVGTYGAGDSVQYPGSTTSTMQTNLTGYFGVGFFKNGTLMPEPTRKVTIPPRTGSTVQMSTINANYTEVLDNTAGTAPLTVAYALQGYIEHYNDTSYGASSATVRFNMYSLPDPNYNWGRATISYILYELP